MPRCQKKPECKSLDQDYDKLGDFSRVVGSKVKVRCKEGMRPREVQDIECALHNVQWSGLDACRVYCDKVDLLVKRLQIDESKCSDSVGGECSVSCAEKHVIIGRHPPGHKFVKCKSSGEWTNPPGFQCKKYCDAPKLRKDMKFADSSKCDAIELGKKCKVKCKASGEKMFINRIKHFVVEIVCGHNSTWTPEPPPCKPHDCDDTYLPPHVELLSPPEVEDDSLDPCFRINGECVIVCKDWSRDFDKNKKFKCRDEGIQIVGGHDLACYPKCSDENARLIYPYKAVNCKQATLSFKTCQITCLDGSQAFGNPEYKCIGGSWYLNQIKCSKACNFFRLPTGANYRTCQALPYIPCEIFCMEGRRFLDGQMTHHIECDHTGDWNTSLPCLGVECVDPNSVVQLIGGATIDMSSCHAKLPGTHCKVRCPHLPEESSAPFVSCNKDYEWFPKIVECRIPCERPRLPPNAMLDLERRPCGLFAHQVCAIKCNKGFKVHGNDNTFTCQASYQTGVGVWSSIPQCVRDDTTGCYDPVHDLFLRRSYIDYTYCDRRSGGRCRVPCFQTNPKLHTPHIICMPDKTWNPAVVNCDMPCPIPDIRRPAVLDLRRPCGFYARQTCHISCPHGYRSHPEADYFVCHEGQRGNFWTAIPECVPTVAVCPHPAQQNPPVMLVESYYDEVNCAIRTPGSRCRVVCRHRNPDLMDPHIVCGTDLRWTPEFVDCNRYCAPPRINPPAFLDTSRPCGFYVGQWCHIVCSPGFVANPPDITCTDGYFRQEPTCVTGEQLCPDPRYGGVHLVRAYIDEASCTRRNPGDRCRVVCVPQNPAKRDPRITCRPDLTWEPNFVDCDRECHSPVLPPYALLDGNTRCGFYVSQECRVVCTQGTVLEGSDPRFWCRQTEQHGVFWTRVPKCVSAG